MKITLGEIGQILDGAVVGREDVLIENIRPIEEADAGDITFIANRKYWKKVKSSKASAIIASPQMREDGKNMVLVPDPYAAVGKLMSIFYPLAHNQSGISPEAFIEEGATVDNEANIFPRAYISHGAKIAAGAVIYPGAYIGRNVSVGADSVLYANVTVYANCVIGRRVILHSGVVIGADGFGFASPGVANSKIPQVGIVQIDDDVEIGANTTIDRATLGKTWIQRNVKIDNQVQIAHNVVIGENSVITAQVGISGSARLGRSVLIGGQTGIVGHISIGDNVMIAAGSGIHKNIPAGQIIAGASTQLPHKLWLKAEACRARLPEMKTALEELKKKVERLQQDKG